ncbi:MAG: hypothetical protein FWD68_20110 [Alphaproteobacteria bacterium]|nr:hypothetical protein [Alphaproteobacteria bacterium]
MNVTDKNSAGEAFRKYRAAAEAGDGDAQVKLAELYFTLPAKPPAMPERITAVLHLRE